MISEITITIDSKTLKQATGMTMEELEAIESDLDFALTDAVTDAFPNADKAQGVAFYVSEPTVEAFDVDGNRLSVDVDFNRSRRRSEIVNYLPSPGGVHPAQSATGESNSGKRKTIRGYHHGWNGNE